jgi:hypothetical protein
MADRFLLNQLSQRRNEYLVTIQHGTMGLIFALCPKEKKKAWFSLSQRGVSIVGEYPAGTLLEYRNQSSPGS